MPTSPHPFPPPPDRPSPADLGHHLQRGGGALLRHRGALPSLRGGPHLLRLVRPQGAWAGLPGAYRGALGQSKGPAGGAQRGEREWQSREGGGEHAVPAPVRNTVADNHRRHHSHPARRSATTSPASPASPAAPQRGSSATLASPAAPTPSVALPMVSSAKPASRAIPALRPALRAWIPSGSAPGQPVRLARSATPLPTPRNATLARNATPSTPTAPPPPRAAAATCSDERARLLQVCNRRPGAPLARSLLSHR